MYIGSQTLGAEIFTNVEVQVVDKKRKIVRQVIKKHNKATRQMVTGILRFLMGNFNASTRNNKPYYTDTEQYIPCYIGVGDGGVVLDEEGYPVYDTETRIPELASDWNEKVPYTSKKLKREFYVKSQAGATLITGSRSPIRKVGNTTQSTPAGDMDTVYFYCEINPGELNTFYGGRPVILSELGLFASEIPNTEDLLAYVKLANYQETTSRGSVNEISDKTRTLYVRTEDTVIVKWYITIAAIGEDSIFAGKEEQVQIVPSVGKVFINNIEPEPTPPVPTYDETKITIIYTDPQTSEQTLYTLDTISEAISALKNETQILPPGKFFEPGTAGLVIGEDCGVTALSNGQFSSILSLNYVRLNTHITVIPNSCFARCFNVETYDIPGPLTSIGDGAFIGNHTTLPNDCALKEFTVPDTVTYIGANAFAHQANLEKVNMPANSTMNLNTYGAFFNCLKLKSFNVPYGVTTLGPYMFANCYLLESIIVPETVTTLTAVPLSGACYNSGGTIPYSGHITFYLGNHSFSPINASLWGFSPGYVTVTEELI